MDDVNECMNAFGLSQEEDLLKVMERMKFGDIFIKWIKMLHEDAKTVFILNSLTKAIQVSFSIRQGDPLAMLLYIIYIEPFLLHLEKTLSGIRINNIVQVLEAYCDDVNIMTDDEADLIKVANAVRKFESMSAAILSRNKKCQVLGFGGWKEGCLATGLCEISKSN